jgi:hypothetical protein
MAPEDLLAYCVHKNLPIDPILKQLNALHCLTPCFLTYTYILFSHLCLRLTLSVIVSISN